MGVSFPFPLPLETPPTHTWEEFLFLEKTALSVNSVYHTGWLGMGQGKHLW